MSPSYLIILNFLSNIKQCIQDVVLNLPTVRCKIVEIRFFRAEISVTSLIKKYYFLLLQSKKGISLDYHMSKVRRYFSLQIYHSKYKMPYSPITDCISKNTYICWQQYILFSIWWPYGIQSVKSWKYVRKTSKIVGKVGKGSEK